MKKITMKKVKEFLKVVYQIVNFIIKIIMFINSLS